MRWLLLVLLAVPPARACDADDCQWSMGMRLQRQGEHERAIALFQEGFSRTHHPKFLFGIAESRREMGQCSEAARLYQLYLATAPQAANRDQAEAHRGDCQDAPLPPLTHFDEPTPPRPGSALRGWGAGFLVAGILISLTGLGLSVNPERGYLQPTVLGLVASGVVVSGGGGAMLGVGIARER